MIDIIGNIVEGFSIGWEEYYGLNVLASGILAYLLMFSLLAIFLRLTFLVFSFVFRGD